MVATIFQINLSIIKTFWKHLDLLNKSKNNNYKYYLCLREKTILTNFCKYDYTLKFFGNLLAFFCFYSDIILVLFFPIQKNNKYI